MFPINFNFPYRKKDGSIITMEKALDGAGADLDLVDLDDVAITTPENGDMLVYNSTSEKWENVKPDIGDLDDVSITTPENGDLLQYNSESGKWEASDSVIEHLGNIDEKLGAELYTHTVQSGETYRAVLNDLWNNFIDSFTGDKSRLKLIWRRSTLGLDYQCPAIIKGGTYIRFGIYGISSATESSYTQYEVSTSSSVMRTMIFNTNGTITLYDNSTQDANVGDMFVIAYQ